MEHLISKVVKVKLFNGNVVKGIVENVSEKFDKPIINFLYIINFNNNILQIHEWAYIQETNDGVFYSQIDEKT